MEAPQIAQINADNQVKGRLIFKKPKKNLCKSVRICGEKNGGTRDWLAYIRIKATKTRKTNFMEMHFSLPKKATILLGKFRHYVVFLKIS